MLRALPYRWHGSTPVIGSGMEQKKFTVRRGWFCARAESGRRGKRKPMGPVVSSGRRKFWRFVRWIGAELPQETSVRKSLIFSTRALVTSLLPSRHRRTSIPFRHKHFLFFRLYFSSPLSFPALLVPLGDDKWTRGSRARWIEASL